MTATSSEFSGDSHDPSAEWRGEESNGVAATAHGQGSVQFAGDNYGGVEQLFHQVHVSEAAAERLFRRTTAPPPMNPEELSRLRHSFVPPERYDRAWDELRDSYTVVITGEHGSGRRSAAMMLLSQVAESRHDLTVDAGSEEDQIDVGSVGEGDGLLLDLSAQPPEQVGRLLSRWSSFRAEVTAKRCFFVIVVPKNVAHVLSNDLREHLVTIGRPDARAVFARHLGKHRVEHDQSDLNSPDLVAWLQRAAMAKVNALARAVRDEEEGGGSFGERLERAFEAFRTHPTQVTTWLAENPENEHQALMLSAAMLEGAPTDAVFTATDDLLDIVESSEDRNSLGRKGISGRLEACGLSVDDSGRVLFGSADFADRVRTYFWKEHPGLRRRLCEWIGRIVPSPALDAESSNYVAVRFAEQALAVGRPDDLPKLVVKWVDGDGSPSPSLLRSSSMLMRAGLLDERFGSSFRRKVYDWVWPSKSPLSSAFDVVLIDLCEQVIAPARPDEALVRLRHLARRKNKHVAEEAAERLNALAGDPLFFRRALNKLAHELRKKDELPDVQLFLRVAVADRVVARGGGLPVVADGAVRGQLVIGWRSAMGRDVSVWEASARGWLDRAIHDSVHGPQLLDVLVEAGGSSADALGRLLGLARRWAREASGEVRRHRSRLVADLRGRIDTSQHLEFLTTAGEKA